MFIYKITNLINGNFYIGKTTRTINIRFNEHCKKPSKRMPITLAIQKYGKENFISEQLDVADCVKDLNAKEIYYISSLKPQYNVSPGGDGGVLREGYKHTEEIKKLLSDLRFGKKDSVETKNKKSASRKKWKHSQETIDKYSNAQAKEYTFIDPNGNVIVIKNLNKYCREHNLASSNMRKVYSGKVNHCKGYRRAFCV